MVKNIIIARHAQSEGNINRSIYASRPDYALRLTSKGVEQATELGEKLKEFSGFSYIVSSPYFRARQTAEIVKENIGARATELQLCDFLIEQEWTGYLSPYSSEMERQRGKFSTFFYRFPNGESGLDVAGRMAMFYNFYLRPVLATDLDNVIIVTHGFSMRVFLKHFFGWDVQTFENLKNSKNCEFYHIKLDNETKDYKLVSEPNWRKKPQTEYLYDRNDIVDTDNLWESDAAVRLVESLKKE